MLKKLHILSGFVLLFILVPGILLAQMNISSSNILSLQGTSRTALVLGQGDNPALVDIGPGGSGQTWDFRNVETDSSIEAIMSFPTPSDGYYYNTYPSANFVQRTMATTEQGIFIIEMYNAVSSNEFRTLGTVFTFGSETFEFHDDVAPLPMSLGTSWVATSIDTSGSIGFESITVDTSWNTIDGDGTVRLPIGDFQALRFRSFSKTISSTTFNGVPFGQPDTTETTSFTWLTREHLQTVSLDSTENGMGEVSLIVSGEVTTLVTDNSHELPEDFMLAQNYPNPFNPQTQIQFAVQRREHVKLRIINLRGQTVRTLANGILNTGQYSLTWDGLNSAGEQVPSGVYFYSLQAGDKVETRKMTLLK